MDKIILRLLQFQQVFPRFDRRLHSDGKLGWIDRFVDIIIGAILKAETKTFQVRNSGKHDNLNIIIDCMLPNLLQNSNPVDFRHNDIKQHDPD